MANMAIWTRRLKFGLGAAACVTLGVAAPASAAALHQSSAAASGGYPSACRHVSYTADGGYYSMGQFYWEPGDDVTLAVSWCYAHDVITSYSVSFTTNIQSSQQPRITKFDTLNASASALKAGVYGTYDSGVLNNIGSIGISGHVTATGHHHFRDTSGAGG